MCVNLCKRIYLMMNDVHMILVSEHSKVMHECMKYDAHMYAYKTPTFT